MEYFPPESLMMILNFNPEELISQSMRLHESAQSEVNMLKLH
jgi:hypothetical protein